MCLQSRGKLVSGRQDGWKYNWKLSRGPLSNIWQALRQDGRLPLNLVRFCSPFASILSNALCQATAYRAVYGRKFLVVAKWLLLCINDDGAIADENLRQYLYLQIWPEEPALSVMIKRGSFRGVTLCIHK